MSEAAKATNVTAARERIRTTLTDLTAGRCPFCQHLVLKRTAGQYRGTPAHRDCVALQEVADLREEFNRLRSYLFGPIPKEAM